ncbi:hypothetical protein BU25DRAFT_50603 [Macroventuria anomochaeta]|uniref:Uncharacterized protein n=1 Tax=Macroventuria anomochaeta TaxID=301207 RepID=A0ACB6S030_9PLEO|nr:uncharacterized protein BU25DRAFT_50603 [Macroventuria anomochaeta]KAF2627585.1 hypothetical protein BU25DRAFT_50603 [Macroventuria anomochaeta]
MSSPRRVVVRLRPGTDGNASHVPKPGTHTQLNPPTLYLEKIGDQWMKARGEAQPGVKYILESLPVGYTLWQRPRPKEPKHSDRYLYGHPDGKPFDSPNRFYPHFQHLMDNAGDRMGCPCTVCNSSSGVLPKSSSSSIKAAPSAQYKGRPKLLGVGMDTTRVDEEGTPDVYRNLINKLRRQGEIDETIQEPMSLDWRAEQETLPGLLRKLKDSPQWVPRVGDIVLYVRELPEHFHIIRHPITGDYKMYDEKTKLWLDHPTWEAGLVGQTPAESISIEDICDNGDKESNVTYSGVRVEPLPDVNSLDKSLSKRHKYIPVRHTRPFILWKQLLHQVPKWHPTILNAQAVTSTLSLTGKYHFKGAWPEASIYCRGMYIGHEMLAVGDAVRLLPNINHGQRTSTDILVIKSIRLKWSNIDNASDNDWDEGTPYNSAVWIYGAAYTSDPARMNKEWLSDAHPPKAADDYGEWYPLHQPSKELAIPYSRILGRLYERDAMALWLNTKSNDLPLLDTGREGLVESRIFSRQHDNRIARELDATWYWGDSRAQALDLHIINGLDVAAHDRLRDPKEWRKKIKVMEGMTLNKGVPAARPTGGPGLAGQNLRGFMAPALSNLPVRSQLSRTTDAASTSGSVTGSLTTGQSSATGASRKRSHIINLSSDEEDDKDDEVNEEIKQTMRVVEDSSQVQAKKARVTVVIV